MARKPNILKKVAAIAKTAVAFDFDKLECFLNHVVLHCPEPGKREETLEGLLMVFFTRTSPSKEESIREMILEPFIRLAHVQVPLEIYPFLITDHSGEYLEILERHQAQLVLVHLAVRAETAPDRVRLTDPFFLNQVTGLAYTQDEFQSRVNQFLGEFATYSKVEIADLLAFGNKEARYFFPARKLLTAKRPRGHMSSRVESALRDRAKAGYQALHQYIQSGITDIPSQFWFWETLEKSCHQAYRLSLAVFADTIEEYNRKECKIKRHLYHSR